ncbi:ATP-binding protein [Sulfurovum riftiae]|nr:ATP-binding protein [Sulfurovum riftiae]
MGYSFESAVADIIDNSITANAKNIKIYFDIHENRLSLAILDDGLGMDRDTLIEAMRPGSKNPLDNRDKNDLGRFGLGLKTASFSQCRKLTVVSSQNNIKTAALWDLDYVAEQNDWSLQLPEKEELNNLYMIENLEENGTLVIWENTDRIIDDTVVEKTEHIIYEKIQDLQKHLELVFHRYLAGKDKISIYINDSQLKPFDPFFTAHPATDELQKEIIVVNGEKVHIQPYLLPHYTKVSAHDYEYYAGVGGYLKNQGFYVYRNKRLLISGTWFRLIPQSEMYKLARIKIDLPNSLDHLWKIDVKKSHASPPAIIKNRLKKIIEKIAGASTRVYKSKGARLAKSDVAFWERYSARGEIRYTVNKGHPMIDAFVKKLNKEQKYEFSEILDLIADFFPKDTLYADLGNNPKEVVFENIVTDTELEEKALLLYQNKLFTLENLGILNKMEPFSKYTKNWEKFFAEQIQKGKI